MESVYPDWCRLEANNVANKAEKRGEKYLVIDVCNITRVKDSTHRVDDIFKVLEFFRSILVKLVFVASSALKYKVDEAERFHDLLKKGVILESPAGCDGDLFILEIATKFGGYILSNDLFRNYRKDYPATISRRIPIMYIQDKLIIPRSFLVPFSRRLPISTRSGGGIQ